MSAPTILNSLGNCFAVVDGFVAGWPDDPAAATVELCAGSEPLHGALFTGPTRGEADAVMRMHNADGSRGEMCGNGLRCLAKFLYERGHARREEIAVETDAGLRRAWPDVREGVVHAVRVDLGASDVLAVRKLVALEGGEVVELAHVQVGNPHAVVIVEDEGAAPVDTLGPALEVHPAFPGGTNVHFAAPRGKEIGLRSWERGVGETPACGTGAAAAAVAAIRLGLAVSPVWVRSPGGTLEVEWDRWGHALQTGRVDDGRDPGEEAA